VPGSLVHKELHGDQQEGTSEEDAMVKWILIISIVLLLITGSSTPAQQYCGSARDFLMRARELLNLEADRTELDKSLQLLKQAINMCPSLGDAWYYRSLVEQKLNNQRDADYALAKARQFGSEALAERYNPFTLAAAAPAPVSGEVGISPTVRDKWALVVGVGNFSDQRINPLNYTTKDAKDFAALLSNKDYGRFNPDHVRILTDDEATTKAIKENLNWLARNAEKGDLVVVYLSSHGSPREMDTAGVSYVVTHDTDVSSQDSLYATALPMVDFADAVRTRIKAQRAVIFLDTCYSGAATQDAKALAAEGIGVSTDTLNRIRQGVGRVIITASKADERSWESDTLKNGYFTYYLIEGLKQKNGLAPIEKVYGYLKDKVSQQVRKEKGVSQTAVMSRSEQVGEIYIGVDTEGNQVAGAPASVIAQNQAQVGSRELFYDPATGVALQANERRRDPKTGMLRVKLAKPEEVKYVGIHYWLELEGVGLVTDDRVFRTGNRIKLHVRSNADGYLSLWTLDPSGRGQLLYPPPGRTGGGNFVKADTDYTHPGFITFKPPAEEERLVVFFSRSSADIPAPTGKGGDAETVATALRPKGEKALIFEEETVKQNPDEVGTYVVNRSGGPVMKEIRLKHQPPDGRQ